LNNAVSPAALASDARGGGAAGWFCCRVSCGAAAHPGGEFCGKE